MYTPKLIVTDRNSDMTVVAIKKRSSARWYFRVFRDGSLFPLVLDSRRDMVSKTYFSKEEAAEAGCYYRDVMLNVMAGGHPAAMLVA